jgi:hypothetical protein
MRARAVYPDHATIRVHEGGLPMRLMVRSIVAFVASGALLTVMAGMVMAGGWAQVVAVDDSGGPPVAGEEQAFRFRLLQHGVTPVDFGGAQVIATLEETGERIVTDATSAGDGEWVAQMTLPTAGDWQIVVAHTDLETTDVASLTVLDGASGALSASPALPALLMLAAVAIILLAAGTGLVMSRAARRDQKPIEVAAKG